MEINIKMLNVGDGDCIIIHLIKSVKEQLVILIDGGHAGDASNTITELDKILAASQKKGPDLIICTHYDSDHIGGLKKIAENYKKNIGEVWIHQPGIQKAAIELAKKIKENPALETTAELLNEAEEYKKTVIGNNLGKESEMVLESYTQMSDLVICLDKEKIKHIEPFSGQTLKGWENEIQVLGPTKTFYNACYNKLVKPSAVLLAEVKALNSKGLLLENKKMLLTPIAKKILNPCEYLDEQKKDHVTEVNQVSVILQIIAANKKYLFTGDASLQSFENIPGYPNTLKNIYWLKVPHHGSHNNSSCELFDIMDPTYAYISGGDRYLDDEVPNCLRERGVTVKTTRDDGDIAFP